MQHLAIVFNCYKAFLCNRSHYIKEKCPVSRRVKMNAPLKQFESELNYYLVLKLFSPIVETYTIQFTKICSGSLVQLIFRIPTIAQTSQFINYH